MVIETDADRTNLLAGWGITATKGSDTFTAIFENDYVEIGDIVGLRPTALARSVDITAYSVAVGDTLTINSTTYIVRIVQPDGTGMTLLILEDQT